MTRSAKKPNPLRGKKASVQLTRNGLTIEIADVSAADASQVAGILLSAMRVMVKNGFDELVVDLGALNGGTLGEVPDDDAEIETRRIGF